MINFRRSLPVTMRDSTPRCPKHGVSNYVKLPDAISFLKVRGLLCQCEKWHFTKSTIGPAWMPLMRATDWLCSTYQSAYDGLFTCNTYRISKPYNNIGAAYYTRCRQNQRCFYPVEFFLRKQDSTINSGEPLGLGVTYFDAIQGPEL